MQIDHELVTVLDGIVLMGVAMGLVAFMAVVTLSRRLIEAGGDGGPGPG